MAVQCAAGVPAAEQNGDKLGSGLRNTGTGTGPLAERDAACDARDGNKFEANNSVTRIQSEPSNISSQRDPKTIVGTCYLVN